MALRDSCKTRSLACKITGGNSQPIVQSWPVEQPIRLHFYAVSSALAPFVKISKKVARRGRWRTGGWWRFIKDQSRSGGRCAEITISNQYDKMDAKGNVGPSFHTPRSWASRGECNQAESMSCQRGARGGQAEVEQTRRRGRGRAGGKLPPRQRGEGRTWRAALWLGGGVRGVAVVGRGRVGAGGRPQEGRRKGVGEGGVGRGPSKRGLGEGVRGVEGAVHEVQGAEGAVKQGAAQHKEVVLAGHVGGVLEGGHQVVGRGRVGVGGHGDAAGQELLKEEADVQGGGDGVGKGEQLAGAGAPADAAGAVGSPVEEGKAVGVIGERDEVADLAAVEGGDGESGVGRVDLDEEGGAVELGVVERQGRGDEGFQRVIGAAGVGAGGAGQVGELRSVSQDVGAGDAADPEELGSGRVEGLGVCEGGGERGRQDERGDGGGVGAGVAVDAGGVGACCDAGELDVVVVRAVGGVGLEDGGDGGEEGGVAGVEGVVDVG